MKRFRIFLFIGILSSAFLIYSCSVPQKTPIFYEYKDGVRNLIDSVLLELDHSYLKPSGTNQKKFVKMGSFSGNTTMIFNYVENMPNTVQQQILNSNRYLKVMNDKIPIIFDSDDGNSMIRKLGVNHGNIGGYLIEINNYGDLIIADIVN